MIIIFIYTFNCVNANKNKLKPKELLLFNNVVTYFLFNFVRMFKFGNFSY